MKCIDVIVEDTKITITGFSLGEVFEYTEKLWRFLKAAIPNQDHDSILLEISALSSLRKLEFKWSISIEVLCDSGDKLLKHILSNLIRENFLMNYRLKLI